MLCDERGLPVSGAREEDILAVDAFREGLLAMQGGIEGVLEAAEASPGCPALQIYAGIFLLCAGTREGTTAAIQWLDRAQQAMAGATDRESLLLEAARRWSQNENESALDLFEDVTAQHPRDLVAAKACEFNYYVTGQHHQASRFLAHMERFAPHNQDHADALAMYAFALELAGRYDEARAEAEKAVALHFESAWAQHALAHVAIMTGDVERGMAEQEGFLSTWTKPGLSIHGHNAWHLALFKLEMGDGEGVMKLFHDLIWGHAPESTTEQVDAISLLWRMELAGCEVDEALWAELAEFCAPLSDQAIVPFVVAHHAHALARAGRDEDVERLRGAVDRSAREQPSARQAVWHEAGIPVIDAAIAWARRDAARVVEALEPAVREIPRVGGSDAQDDVFRMTLVEAFSRIGRRDSVQAISSMFPGHRPMRPL